MTEQSLPKSTWCLLCGRRLRNAIFCPLCSSSLCSRECYLKHVADQSVCKGRELNADVPSGTGRQRSSDGPQALDVSDHKIR
jgi:hypothetical protein